MIVALASAFVFRGFIIVVLSVVATAIDMELFFLLLAAGYCSVLWGRALLDIARGSFLREWYEERKLPMARRCWFLFVSATWVFGEMSYNVWKREKKRDSDMDGEPPHKWSVWDLFAFCFIGGILMPDVFILGVFPLFCVILVTGLIGSSPSSGTYNPICGGFFLPLVRRFLPGLAGLPDAERQRRFSALYGAAQGKGPFRQMHFLLSGLLLGAALYLMAMFLIDWYYWGRQRLSMGDGFPPYGAWGVWLLSLVAFKVLVWDAVMAWILHGLMKKDKYAF